LILSLYIFLYYNPWQRKGFLFKKWIRVTARGAEINKYAKIAPDFGSPSRRAKGSILPICDFWCNAEGGQKDKSAVADGFICFRDP